MNLEGDLAHHIQRDDEGRLAFTRLLEDPAVEVGPFAEAEVYASRLIDQVAPMGTAQSRRAAETVWRLIVVAEYHRLTRTLACGCATALVQHRAGCPAAPCPCECNSGGRCGGCGHAGCGGRR